jgi:nitrite reductase/ring-hydroxylating ferredoxin subunit
MNKVVTYSLFLFLITLLFHGSGCKKDNNAVPVIYTDVYLYTTDPAFAPLNATSGYAYIAGGSKGILVYRKSQTEFMAYDRHCTYKVENGNVVTVDASGLLAADAACGSKFLITDGSPSQGSAINPLKRYQTAFDGTVLHIYN